jgi:hypothetical protein
MNKKILISVGVLVILALAVAYWLLSPFWRNVALNEKLPGSTVSTAPIKDNLSVMDADTKADFEKQTETMKNKVMESGDSMPSNESNILTKAVMVARAHDVKGEALLVNVGGQNFLRFENLETINAPDLRIYLSSDLSNDDIIDLGPIKATRGNVNYEIPLGTNLSKYKNAMIWCRAFSVLFSYAQF